MRFWKFSKFPINWRQSEICDSIRLEMTSKRKSLLFFEIARKMMRRFAPFPLMSASHIWQFQLGFFFTFYLFLQYQRVSMSPWVIRVETLCFMKKGRPTARSLSSLEAVWKNITPAYLRSLYELMPRWMKAVVDAEGGHTKYWTIFACILPSWPINQLI